jgi:hypothetical protein
MMGKVSGRACRGRIGFRAFLTYVKVGMEYFWRNETDVRTAALLYFAGA